MADDSRTTDRPDEEVAGGRVTRREILQEGRRGHAPDRLRRSGAEDRCRRRPQVPPQGAGGNAPDHPVEPLRPGLRQVVRQHLRQALGRGERHRGARRPHQPGRHPGAGRRRGGRPERARPLLLPLAAGRVRGPGDRPRGHRPGGLEEARQDEDRRAEGDLQPEDEEVLRLLRQLRARPGATTGPTSGARSGSSRRAGTTCSRPRRSCGRWATRSGSACRTRSTRTWP